MALDLLIFQFFYQVAERLSFFNFFIVSLAVYLPWAIGFAMLLIILGEKDRRARVWGFLFTLLMVVVSRGIIGEVLQFFIMRARPYELLGFKPLFEVTSSSFPSGHALLLFAFVFSVWRIRREWAGWFLVATILNLIARVLSGVHWPSDVIAGALIAWVIYILLTRLFKEEKVTSPEEVNTV